MYTTNTRIKKLRKTLDLTQEAFASRIGVKRNTVATYEIGRNVPLDAVVANICREFHVNEEWLRTGNGEMFQPEPHDELDAIIERHGLPREVRSMLEKFIALKPDQQEAVIAYVKSVAADINAMDLPAAHPPKADDPPPWEQPADQHAIWEAEARAEAEQVYREVLEEKRAPGGSSPSGGQSAEGA